MLTVWFLALLTSCGATPTSAGPDAGTPPLSGAAIPPGLLPEVPGADPTIACQQLLAAYNAAVFVALSCNVTAPGQCQKTVPYLSIGCPALCQATVNEDSALLPLIAAWNQLGCSDLRGYACLQGCRSNRLGICGVENSVTICDPDS
jgi:hypothetical protein